MKGKKAASKKKVFVGLSGGVDSSVSAALLVRAGYDVTGVFIKVWQPEFIACTSREDRLDAMRVAAHLNIPFRTLDLEEEYKEGVVDYMLREYGRGNTPNPDAMCNKEVKFGAFLSYARREGADYIATGHYARNIFNRKTGKYELHEAVDKNKDQSYFLWNLGQKELAHVLFPVGALQKSEVRKLAKKFGLITATKKDSQGLCFVGKVDMKEFLSHYIKPVPGNVRNEEGKIIGRHQGAVLYTLGERRGFMIDGEYGEGRPQYVVGKNLKKNELIVSARPKPSADNGIITTTSANFISGAPTKGALYAARFRYRQKRAPCRLESAGSGRFSVRPSVPDYTVSAGQSLVLYLGSRCVGGGVIA